MTRSTVRLVLSMTAAVAGLLVTAVAPAAAVPPAAAAPSCVAQTIAVEHEIYGTAWGHDVIAFFATHPEVLAEFGFRSLGDLVSYAAHQDRAACPADI